MVANGRSLVVIQLSGGNDYMNTVVPHGNGLYYDHRPFVRVEQDEVIDLDGYLGLNPNLPHFKDLWDEGNMAIVNGIGYENPSRSHFRAMDIWHTAEPDVVGDAGWLGRVIRDIDPNAENVLTGINIGRGLPRAMACNGVPVASVGNLETYGLFPDKVDDWNRRYALECFSKMYGARGRDAVIEVLSQTGSNALKGADILRTAPEKYTSSVEYGSTEIAQSLKAVAQVMFADLGTRVYYTSMGNFDSHAGQVPVQAKLLHELSPALRDFTDDVKEHGRENDVVILMFTEFGRRVRDNGSGTDHGWGGGAFVFGKPVAGGMYGEYPSLKEADLVEGDLRFNNDFRCTYSTILERWMGLEAAPIVNGTFEHFDFLPN